jgi:hypothetical protein
MAKTKGAGYAVSEEAKFIGVRGKRCGVLEESCCIKD